MSGRLEKDLKRIDSIHNAVHRFEAESPALPRLVEIDPSRLNLDKLADFVNFLRALERRESRSLKFLQKMPEQRINTLKIKHSRAQALFHLLEK